MAKVATLATFEQFCSSIEYSLIFSTAPCTAIYNPLLHGVLVKKLTINTIFQGMTETLLLPFLKGY